MTDYHSKKELRKIFLEKRKSLTPAYRQQADAAICNNLFQLEELTNVGCIAGFISDGYEPDLAEYYKRIMAKGITCLFPRYNKTIKKGEYELAEVVNLERDLVVGAYGIKEPIPDIPSVNTIKQDGLIWLIPGVVFDRHGNRLGRGKGVYDQLLESNSNVKVGIFYTCQECTAVPIAEHDQALDIIITEAEVIHL